MAQCDVPDKLVMFSYLTQLYEAFRGEIPYIKHPKLVSNCTDCFVYQYNLKKIFNAKDIPYVRFKWNCGIIL